MWRVAPYDEQTSSLRYPGSDLRYGHVGDAKIVLRVRYDVRRRTFYFVSRETGRSSLLAGERFPTLAQARSAGRAWVRDEIRAGRLA